MSKQTDLTILRAMMSGELTFGYCAENNGAIQKIAMSWSDNRHVEYQVEPTTRENLVKLKDDLQWAIGQIDKWNFKK